MSNIQLLGRLALFALISGGLVACGGGGASGGGSLPASPVTNVTPLSGQDTIPGATPAPVVSDSVSTATTATLQAAGSIASTNSDGFTLNSGYPHGYVHVIISSATAFAGAKPFIGEKVSVAGNGSFTTGIDATAVTQAGVASPTPGPTVAPAGGGGSSTPSSATLMTSAKTGIGLFQVFDAFGSPRVTSAEAVADGPRYGIIWGARPGMASAWRANNPSLIATYYMPQETDASYVEWGAVGHDLTWWNANHPTWVLYACTANGAATRTPAMVGSLPHNIPLDIHNPAVVDYQIRTAANYAIHNGYNGLAYDEVLFYNVGGLNVGAGGYGCGIYQNGSFVRRYSGKVDSNWNSDTVAWVKAAHRILTTDATLAPYHLKLVVNHPAGSISDPNEQAILQNVDADLNESGYASYGNYVRSNGFFKATADWTIYAQTHGTAALNIDKFVQSSALSAAQVEYSIATYMISNQGGEGLFAGTAYGIEQYHTQYAAAYGSACSNYYASTDSANPNLYYRKYSGALVVVNSGSSRSYETARLPSGHTYRDVMGRSITNPLNVANHDAYVLLTTNGCQ